MYQKVYSERNKNKKSYSYRLRTKTRKKFSNFADIKKILLNTMTETKHIKISDYNYPLPDERIAKFPLPVRDQSKLLVYRHGEVSETVFTSLPDYMEPGMLMVFNNTKVIQARLHFRKETGALIEIFCLEPIQPNDYVLNFQQTHHAAWLCMIGNLKKWKEGPLHKEMTVKGKTITLTATRGECHGTSHWVDFTWDNPGSYLCRYTGSIRRTAYSTLSES